MGWWTERVLPRCVDRTLSVPPVMERRADVCAGLTGRVLELGFGSGLNVDLYPAAVNAVDAVEPADLAWSLSAERRASASVPVDRVGLDGARLAADDESYDAALSTFTLCTIPDVDSALQEVRRVLRSGAAFHVLEHGLSPERRVAGWQRRLDPVQQLVCGGCHLARDVPGLLREAGFTVRDLREGYLPGPGLGKPWAWGTLAIAVAD